MKKIDNVTIGADPELFLQNELELISAEGLIGGTKEDPLSVPGLPGYFIQEDNVMVEFNIPPSNTEEMFCEGIETMIDYIQMTGVVHDATISKLASGELNPIFLNTFQARQFGCEPDYNAHTLDANKPPIPMGELRTCGGHLHIGFDNPTTEISIKIIQAMDMVLGLSSLFLDKDDRRREMYGKAGAFRFKKYGVEYRTLSNFWIFDKKLIKWAYNGTIAAIELVNSGVIDELYERYGVTTQNCIDKNNKELAKKTLKEINNFIKNKNLCVESLDTQGKTLKK